MIKVKITYLDKKFSSLSVKGHANSDVYGKDTVCAAVSAVVTGGLNALDDIRKYDYTFEEGNIYLAAKENISNHDEIVIETIVTGLKTIEESYPKFIKIEQ